MSNDRIWLCLCVAAYVTLCVAHARVWEPAHDEGVTFTQAIGRLSLGRPGATEPLPVRQLYAAIGGGSAHGPADVIASLLRNNGMHPPAYYLGLNAWTAVAGTSRLALAFPAYLCGVLALLAMRRLAKRVGGVGAGNAAVLLLAVSPWFAGFSNYARPYAIALCLTIASSLAMLEMRGRPRHGWRGAFVVLSLLGLYTIYHYTFVLVWQAVLLGVLAWRAGPARARELALAVGLGASILLGFAPWLPKLVSHLEATGGGTHYFSGWLELGAWLTGGARLLERFALGEAFRSVAAAPLRITLVVLSLGTVPLFLRSFRAAEEPAVRLFWLTLPLLPALILLADLWHGTHTLIHSKTSFALLPFLLLALARASQALPRARMRRLVLAAWASLFVAASLANVYTLGRSDTDLEAVAQTLAASDEASHVVVISANLRGHTVPLLLALRDAKVERVRLVAAPAGALEAVLSTLLADGSVSRLTLLDFAIPYQPSGRWTPALIGDVEARARAVRWEVRHLTPQAAGGAPRRGTGSLWILSPVEARYFDV